MISAWILVFLCESCSGTKVETVGEYATQQACTSAKDQVSKTSRARWLHDALICVHNGGK